MSCYSLCSKDKFVACCELLHTMMPYDHMLSTENYSTMWDRIVSTHHYSILDDPFVTLTINRELRNFNFSAGDAEELYKRSVNLAKITNYGYAPVAAENPTESLKEEISEIPMIKVSFYVQEYETFMEALEYLRKYLFIHITNSYNCCICCITISSCLDSIRDQLPYYNRLWSIEDLFNRCLFTFGKKLQFDLTIHPKFNTISLKVIKENHTNGVTPLKRGEIEKAFIAELYKCTAENVKESLL